MPPTTEALPNKVTRNNSDTNFTTPLVTARSDEYKFACGYSVTEFRQFPFFRASGGLHARLVVQFITTIGVVLCTLALTSSCSLEPEEPFRVGTNSWPGYEPLYLARDLGQYAGSDIRLVELPNASEVIQALRNGMLEAAALTLDEVLTVVQDDYDLKIVLIMDYSNGGDALLADPSIANLAELRGKRLGVENTAVGAIVLDAALDRADLSMADLNLKAMTVDEHVDAYRSRSIDALVTFEPARSRILALGAKSLFDSSAIPGRIVDVLAVQGDVIDRRSASLSRLLSGYFTALAYQKHSPREASKRTAARMHIPADKVLEIYQGLYQPDLNENQILLRPPAKQFQSTVRQLVELMSARDMLHRSPKIDSLIDGRWLPDSF